MGSNERTTIIRKRVENYRIVFTIKNDQLIVTVLKIDNRGDVYKK